MQPVTHVLCGGAAAAALTPWLGRDALVFGAASVAIDIDHYLDFLYFNRFTDWSVRRMLAFHAEIWTRRHRPDLIGLSIFHTAEWTALLVAVASVSGSAVAWAALGGVLFHIALDLLSLTRHGILRRRAHSVVEYAVRRRRLLRAGLDPAGVFREALAAIGPRPGFR